MGLLTWTLSLTCLRGKNALLALGILVRIVTFSFLAPENNDHHGDVLKYLVDYHRLPLVGQAHEAHNPPLYYVLAAPILAWTGSMKAAQSLSLVFSLATLCIFFWLIYFSGLIAGRRARLYSFVMVCVLPQFVMFSLYVSSDTLATLLGAMIAVETWRYVQSPGWKRLLMLAFTLALGLLTKSTFVAAIPVLLALVFWYPRARRPGWNGLLRADAFLVIALLVGGYKFADNLVRYRDPFYNNMSLLEEWHLDHMRSYRGFSSFADFNVGRLLISPIVSPATDGSYPVLLYGTFWYQHIPESSFTGLLGSPFKYLGSIIFALALIPTAVFFTGLGRLGRRMPALLRGIHASQAPPAYEDQRRLALSALAMILVLEVALLDATALRYHEWSIFQARFLFPWISAGIAAFSAGVPAAATRPASILNRAATITLAVAMAALTALFILYLSSEIALLLWPLVQSAATPR